MPAPKRICRACGKHGANVTPARLYWAETGKYKVVGYFCKGKHKTERQQLLTLERHERQQEAQETAKPLADRITCEEAVARYLAEHEDQWKHGSLGTARQQLRRFRDDLGDRPLGSIDREAAKEWAGRVRKNGRPTPKGEVSRVRALFAWAFREDLYRDPRNPFTGLAKSGKGRANLDAPTTDEIEALRDACAALGDYAPRMRDFIDFAALTLMRPSELYELRWSDIDLAAGVIHKDRALYRGVVSEPKTGARLIPLPGPAESILMRQPTRGGELVFVSKQGKRLTSSTFSQYWAEVQARAKRDRLDPRSDPYFICKHYGVHLLATEGLSARAIASQAGWGESTAEAMMKVYGHLHEAGFKEMQAHWQAKRKVVQIGAAA